MRKITKYLLIFTVLLFFFQFISSPVFAEGEIIFDCYYNTNCGSCVRTKENIVDPVLVMFENETDKITFTIKDIATNEVYKKEYDDYQANYSLSYPFIIIKNETNMTIIRNTDMHSYSPNEIKESLQYINETLQAFLAGVKVNETNDNLVVDTPFGRIEINVSSLSLPILTVVLGGADSLNPCAFFILIILLSILVHAQSRRRMLLIGGIFIFFSGFLYAVFMFVLFNVFFLTRDIVGIITIVAGVIAVSLGVLDVKDFFFFKKGASISIPEDKKPGIYQQMRDLVKNPRITAAVVGTVVLAGTVNFYELLCTLGLPLVFTQNLATYDLSLFEYYLYIFFYNVVYVIPLIIIVLIFVFTVGRFKLTEWHGRVLKLFAGSMLTSFGVILLFDYQILENVLTPILLLLFITIFTVVVSKLYKYKFMRDEDE